jgi:hypothetical protein
MKWVLIVFVMHTPPAQTATVANYPSEQACIEAGQKVVGWGGNRNIYASYFCLKGDSQ